MRYMPSGDASKFSRRSSNVEAEKSKSVGAVGGGGGGGSKLNLGGRKKDTKQGPML
jgi:hypothetical protein